MADWKTYAKAARNTARKQAPEARDAARRASDRAGGYVRAAGKAIDEGRDHDRDEHSSPRTTTTPRPTIDGDRLRKDAAAYYAVANRRVTAANIVPRIMRALRDALLIGMSLFIIWGVLAAAGIPIPFTTVLIIVGVIVAVSFVGGVYAQWKRAQDARPPAAEPQD